jgi:hypothetical protein
MKNCKCFDCGYCEETFIVTKRVNPNGFGGTPQLRCFNDDCDEILDPSGSCVEIRTPLYESLTTRGWVVLITLGVLIIFGLMALWGDRMVICDWRGGYEPCKIERFGDVVKGWNP